MVIAAARTRSFGSFGSGCWRTTTALLSLQSSSFRRAVGAMMSTASTATAKSNKNHQKNRIAVAQLCSSSSKFENLLNVAQCAGWAIHPQNDHDDSRDEGNPASCSMLFLPECFGFLGSSSEQTLAAAEPMPTTHDEHKHQNSELVKHALVQKVKESAMSGMPPPPPPFVQDKGGTVDKDEAAGTVKLSEEQDREISLLDGLRTIAAASNMWISAGGMHVGVPDEPRVYNTHVIVDECGALRSLYRKMHLFDVSIPGKVDLRESKTTKAGEELVVCPDSPIGCLGVTICYDLRFPEMYVKLTQEMGAQILLVPSAFTVPTGQAHWHALLRARAIENQCFVVAAAQYGKHNAKRESYGHSLVVDPWGTIIADAGGVDNSCRPAPSIVTCEIDLNMIASIRERLPVQEHRRQTRGT